MLLWNLACGCRTPEERRGGVLEPIPQGTHNGVPVIHAPYLWMTNPEEREKILQRFGIDPNALVFAAKLKRRRVLLPGEVYYVSRTEEGVYYPLIDDVMKNSDYVRPLALFYEKQPGPMGFITNYAFYEVRKPLTASAQTYMRSVSLADYYVPPPEVGNIHLFGVYFREEPLKIHGLTRSDFLAREHIARGFLSRCRQLGWGGFVFPGTGGMEIYAPVGDIKRLVAELNQYVAEHPGWRWGWTENESIPLYNTSQQLTSPPAPSEPIQTPPTPPTPTEPIQAPPRTRVVETPSSETPHYMPTIPGSPTTGPFSIAGLQLSPGIVAILAIGVLGVLFLLQRRK